MATATLEVLPQQADLVECKARFLGAYGGVGSGKTFSAQLKMWKGVRQFPKAGAYVVGADFEQLRGGYFLDFRELLEDVLGWKETKDYRYRDLPRPQIIINDTGARIRALSAELAERIRSTRIHLLHAEEPQTWHNGEKVWRTLVGRMRHTVRTAHAHPDLKMQAWLTFNPVGTPIGHWLHTLITERWPQVVDACEACGAGNNCCKTSGYPTWRFSLRDNYLLPDLATTIANIEDNLPPSQIPVEVDGHFPTRGGGAYREFDQLVHCGAVPEGLPPIGLRPEPLLWTLDFNVGFQCSIIAQPYVQQPIVEYLGHPVPTKRLPVPGWQQRIFYAIDEIALPDAGVEDVCDAFLSRYEAHAKIHGVVVYGDASGGARSQIMSSRSAIRTNYETIAARLRERGIRVEFRVQSADPAQMDRVTMVNRQLRVGAGYGTLIDAKRCPVLVADLLAVAIKPGTNEIDKSDTTEAGRKRTHSSDAWGYMIWVERQLEAEPQAINWTIVR